jgi:hypothetical protein
MVHHVVHDVAVCAEHGARGNLFEETKDGIDGLTFCERVGSHHAAAETVGQRLQGFDAP